MLVLERRVQEAIMIGDVRVVVTSIEGNRVKLGIDADRSIPVWREEIHKRRERERSDDTA